MFIEVVVLSFESLEHSSDLMQRGGREKAARAGCRKGNKLHLEVKVVLGRCPSRRRNRRQKEAGVKQSTVGAVWFCCLLLNHESVSFEVAFTAV